jgi:hypothetical protein
VDVKGVFTEPSELKYSADPRPTVVDCKPLCKVAELMYSAEPRPTIVEVNEGVLIYPAVPSPTTVETIVLFIVKGVTYIFDIPTMLDCKLIVLTYPEEPKPSTVEYTFVATSPTELR